jgi:hypothetical protein
MAVLVNKTGQIIVAPENAALNGQKWDPGISYIPRSLVYQTSFTSMICWFEFTHVTAPLQQVLLHARFPLLG